MNNMNMKRIQKEPDFIRGQPAECIQKELDFIRRQPADPVADCVRLTEICQMLLNEVVDLRKDVEQLERRCEGGEPRIA